MTIGDFGFAIADAYFVEAIARVVAGNRKPTLVGLSGPQGSGKTTTAVRIATGLGRRGYRAVVCSLDDFYLTRSERAILASEVHPLLATRGVPGTHDLDLLGGIISQVVENPGSREILIPGFDKTIDDRVSVVDWRRVKDPIDVLLIEGWCVGAEPEPAAALVSPINALERSEDRDASWRKYVNRQLAGPYRSVFSRFDLTIMLRTPCFKTVFRWRSEQEYDLLRGHASHAPMTPSELEKFIAHYERVTRWMLASEPADLVADLNTVRMPVSLRLSNRLLS